MVEIICENIQNLKIPRRGDLGIDIVAQSIFKETERLIGYSTGVVLAPVDDFIHTLLVPRSSIINYDLMLGNSIGVIDSGYRSEIIVWFRKFPFLQKDGTVSCKIYEIGDKIAQLFFYKALDFELIPLENITNLTLTERGKNGFGSTGR